MQGDSLLGGGREVRAGVGDADTSEDIEEDLVPEILAYT